MAARQLTPGKASHCGCRQRSSRVIITTKPVASCAQLLTQANPQQICRQVSMGQDGHPIGRLISVARQTQGKQYDLVAAEPLMNSKFPKLAFLGLAHTAYLMQVTLINYITASTPVS